MSDKSYEKFKNELLEILRNNFPERGVNDFDEHPHLDDKRGTFIDFTFLHSEEKAVNKFILDVRNKLLMTPELSEQTESNKYVYEVWKSHIRSHDYWAVHFWLTDNYKFIEDSQP